jgi:hypothetical protein
MKRVIVLSLALLMVISAVALADGAGAFSAFKNGVGARALAMGGAFVAIADDATAVCWNPAGLAQSEDTRITGMSTDQFGLGMVSRLFVGATTSFSNIGIGLSWERVALTGKGTAADGTAGSLINWNESAIVGSLATNIMDIGLAGANVKYYMADTGVGNTASGFGFDLGILVKLGDMFMIGVNASDIGNTNLSWTSGATDAIDGVYTAGMAVSLVDGMLVLATDLDFGMTGLGDVKVGIEFKVIEELALRGGVVLADNFQNPYFSAGAGINVAGLSVDAAYVMKTPNPEFENTLVLSAEFSLGSLLGESEPQPAPATE